MAGALLWNGNTVTFPNPPTAWTPNKIVADKSAHSAGGQQVKHHRFYLWRLHLLLSGPFTEQLESDLWTWWDYALRGNVFGVAFDSTKVLDTTLDASVASGQKRVYLTATTGIVSGDMVVITKADRTAEEVFVVDVVTPGAEVSSTENLKNDFDPGDAVRPFLYFPRVRSMATNTPLEMEEEGTTNYMSLNMVVEEALA